MFKLHPWCVVAGYSTSTYEASMWTGSHIEDWLSSNSTFDLLLFSLVRWVSVVRSQSKCVRLDPKRASISMTWLSRSPPLIVLMIHLCSDEILGGVIRSSRWWLSCNFCYLVVMVLMFFSWILGCWSPALGLAIVTHFDSSDGAVLWCNASSFCMEF